jgi:hypothetical protein
VSALEIVWRLALASHKYNNVVLIVILLGELIVAAIPSWK